MIEISKERADEIDAAWNAATATERLSLPRMSWLCVGGDTSYFESEPSELEKLAAARIAFLEAAIELALGALESGYGALPKHSHPGPPTAIISNLYHALNKDKA